MFSTKTQKVRSNFLKRCGVGGNNFYPFYTTLRIYYYIYIYIYIHTYAIIICYTKTIQCNIISWAKAILLESGELWIHNPVAPTEEPEA